MRVSACVRACVCSVCVRACVRACVWVGRWVRAYVRACDTEIEKGGGGKGRTDDNGTGIISTMEMTTEKYMAN